MFDLELENQCANINELKESTASHDFVGSSEICEKC